MSDGASNPEHIAAEAAAVMAEYAERINHHDFGDVAPLIADDAVFWFSDGSHSGLAAIRAAFEATWAVLTEEIYRIEALRWIAAGDGAASCIHLSLAGHRQWQARSRLRSRNLGFGEAAGRLEDRARTSQPTPVTNARLR